MGSRLPVSASHICCLNPGAEVKAPVDRRGKKICRWLVSEVGWSWAAVWMHVPFFDSLVSQSQRDDSRKCDSRQSRPEFSTFLPVLHQQLQPQLGLVSVETQSSLFHKVFFFSGCCHFRYHLQKALVISQSATLLFIVNVIAMTSNSQNCQPHRSLKLK